MSPEIIAALSGAPASLLCIYIVAVLLKERANGQRDFLAALAEERRAIGDLRALIQRQSGLLLVLIESIAPGRSSTIERDVDRLFAGGAAGAHNG
jgi:hypothetical protein